MKLDSAWPLRKATAPAISVALWMFCLLTGALPIRAATTACIAPPPGLVGWWPGDNNENDIVDGNNPSALSAVTLVPGEVLTGFSFGTKGYIQIPTSPALTNQNFTWAMWARPDGAGPNNDQFGNAILTQNIDDTHNAIGLHWRATDSRFLFDFGSDSTEIVTSADTFPAGTFYFVAATYDGTTFRLFVNGALEGSMAETKTIPYSNSGFIIGSTPPSYIAMGFARTWNGVIDEVQAFNRAPSPSEVQSIFNASSFGECKGPEINDSVSASAFGGFASAAPGSWIEVYGSGLAFHSRGWTGADFSGVDAPTALYGTMVTIGGLPAFTDYISFGQVNAQIPSTIGTGQQQVVVSTSVGVSAAYTLDINALMPGILAPPSFRINGVQYAVALFPDGVTYVLPTGAIAGVPARPAKAGETIVLYGIGFGPVTPDIPAGQIVQQVNSLSSSFQVSIGGMPATASYSGLAPNYVGLYQFNITMPNVSTGNAPLIFSLAGEPGTQTLYIPVAN